MFFWSGGGESLKSLLSRWRYSVPIRIGTGKHFIGAGKITASLLILFFISCNFSCSEKEKNNSSTDSVPVATHDPRPVSGTKTAVSNTGYVITLPEGFNFTSDTADPGEFVYYFTPKDTISIHGQAGIYIGKYPNRKPPSRQYTQNNFSGKLLGQKVNWVEYITDEYTQRETFIDLDSVKHIHVFCHSDRLPDLEQLFDIVNTLSK